MDAIVIAKTLIRERANLNPVRINKNSIALREMTGYRQMLVRESTRIKNRLHVALFNQYRGILGHFGSLFGKLSSCFLCQVPSPDPLMLKGATLNTLTGFLKANLKRKIQQRESKSYTI